MMYPAKETQQDRHYRQIYEDLREERWYLIHVLTTSENCHLFLAAHKIKGDTCCISSEFVFKLNEECAHSCHVLVKAQSL